MLSSTAFSQELNCTISVNMDNLGISERPLLSGFQSAVNDYMNKTRFTNSDWKYDRINYDIVEYFSVRTGFSNEPSSFTAGIGINYTLFSLDYAVFTHPDLGLTHQAGIIISFKPEKK